MKTRTSRPAVPRSVSRPRSPENLLDHTSVKRCLPKTRRSTSPPRKAEVNHINASSKWASNVHLKSGAQQACFWKITLAASCRCVSVLGRRWIKSEPLHRVLDHRDSQSPQKYNTSQHPHFNTSFNAALYDHDQPSHPQLRQEGPLQRHQLRHRLPRPYRTRRLQRLGQDHAAPHAHGRNRGRQRFDSTIQTTSTSATSRKTASKSPAAHSTPKPRAHLATSSSSSKRSKRPMPTPRNGYRGRRILRPDRPDRRVGAAARRTTSRKR